MIFGVQSIEASIMSLQANLAAMTALGMEPFTPHHPITCMTGALAFHDDGSFACEHATAPPDNVRTQAALDASVAILLFEELYKRG